MTMDVEKIMFFLMKKMEPKKVCIFYTYSSFLAGFQTKRKSNRTETGAKTTCPTSSCSHDRLQIQEVRLVRNGGESGALTTLML